MSSSDSDSDRKEAREPAVPPIFPEALLDVVQALGGLTSESAPQREFALKVHKMYFEDLPTKFTADERASSYLREVLAATASAIRGFAVERTAFRAVRAREEKLEELRSRVTSAKFFHAPVDGELGTKVYAIVVKLVGGTIGGATLVKAWAALPWWAVVLVAIATFLWLFFGDLLFALVTVRLQLGAYRNTGDTEGEIRKAWSKSVTSYKELAFQLLVTADRARERWYPESVGLLGAVRWSDALEQGLHAFLDAPSPKLGDRTAADTLSRIVDLHFGVRSTAPLYRAPIGAGDDPQPGHPAAGGENGKPEARRTSDGAKDGPAEQAAEPLEREDSVQ